MQTRGRRYTGSAQSEESSPHLKVLVDIEVYVRGLIDEINADLKDLEAAAATPKNDNVKIRLLSKKSAYKDVLQFIKETVRAP